MSRRYFASYYKKGRGSVFAWIYNSPGTYLYFYGKLEAKPNRKMEHVTVFAEDADKTGGLLLVWLLFVNLIHQR
ncbi:hypothetical protein [Streptococcus pseudoporcinus]|uniref:hypothetical protein n=1 Tax=Streptococcus pseudoporcinus TaxID=361101 RepID=UPI003A4C697A